MTTKTDLLLDVLFQQVKIIPDQPKRILFKGVSNLSDDFRARVVAHGLDWEVQVTGQDEDIVGARNNANIGTLIVFYRDEIRARESLNAFRQFNEDTIAAALVLYVVEAGVFPDSYTKDDLDRLLFLLELVYPSAEQLANFLLAGRNKVSSALPYLGLFTDGNLTLDTNRMSIRQWQARLRENHKAAVIRWRDFLEKGQNNRDAKELLGSARRELLQQAGADPRAKEKILHEVSLSEALSILNPPSQTVLRLMNLGLLRHEAEAFVDKVKDGTIDPQNPPIGTPTLPDDLVRLLKRYKPQDDDEEEEVISSEQEIRRASFCLEGILRFVGQQAPLPSRLGLARADKEDSAAAYLTIGSDERLHVTLTPEVIRTLAVPNEGAGELRFRLFDPEAKEKDKSILTYFTLENQAGNIEGYEEYWPDAKFWQEATGLDPTYVDLWQELEKLTKQLREVIDPYWEPERDSETNVTNMEEMESREPNNPIYLIFDLVYLAHRELFESFFDAWLKVVSLSWQSDSSSSQRWWQTMEGLSKLGLAFSGETVAVLPFYPIRLAWHRAIFQKIEKWLAQATRAYQPLSFDATVLAGQLQVVDRPRVLFSHKERLVEAARTAFFSIFTSDTKRQRTRTPLERARLKLEQFGRMWPFSLARLHLAFQPGDAGDDVYRLVIQHADKQPDAAFRVRALVHNTTTVTAFDRYLLTTTDQTTDLLTQEHFESMLPRVEYAKGQLDPNPDNTQDIVTLHAALLIDAFREEEYGFKLQPGQLKNKHWEDFRVLVKNLTPAALANVKGVELSAVPYHSQEKENNQRELVYVPLSDNKPEYLCLLYDSLIASIRQQTFTEGVYYEVVRWDSAALHRLHRQADWVILFDRTLDKTFFEKELAKEDVKLIDFYPNLRGGYRLSVSSRRIQAVKWQLVQVLRQFFDKGDLNLEQASENIINSLTSFASGLLLKTLGGGSLTQELLGLYATYLALIKEGTYIPGQDFLIPLDNYLNWFGRRTQRGRRADLMVVRVRTPKRLELLAVESKWYKDIQGDNFVEREFGSDGQLRNTVITLYSLFNPKQERLDQGYWQRMLRDLLSEAPNILWQTLQANDWELKVDGTVFVHQYLSKDQAWLSEREKQLNQTVIKYVKREDANHYFWLGPTEQRLKLKSYPQLVSLFAEAGK